MDFKKILLPLMVLMLMAPTFGIITVTVVAPTAGQDFLPNQGEDTMDINFTVVDAIALNSVHTATIQFWNVDANIIVAQDVNLDNSNCSFTTAETWTTPGVSCFFRYTFPISGRPVETGTHVLDINVTGYEQGNLHEADDNVMTVFTVDNRYISTAVETMLNLAPLMLIAAVVVAGALTLAGVITARVALMAAVGAAVAVVATIVLALVMEVLTP